MVGPCGLGCQQLGLCCFAYDGNTSVHGYFASGGITSHPAPIPCSLGEDDSPKPFWNTCTKFKLCWYKGIRPYNTRLELYSCLSVLYVLCLAAFNAAGNLSVKNNVQQLPTRTMQFRADSNVHYSDFRVEYIVIVVFCYHIYQYYIVLWHI